MPAGTPVFEMGQGGHGVPIIRVEELAPGMWRSNYILMAKAPQALPLHPTQPSARSHHGTRVFTPALATLHGTWASHAACDVPVHSCCITAQITGTDHTEPNA